MMPNAPNAMGVLAGGQARPECSQMGNWNYLATGRAGSTPGGGQFGSQPIRPKIRCSKLSPPHDASPQGTSTATLRATRTGTSCSTCTGTLRQTLLVTVSVTV